MDGDGDVDIVAAANQPNTITDPGADLILFVNPGGAAARDHSPILVDVFGFDTNGDGQVDDCDVNVSGGWVHRFIEEDVCPATSLEIFDADTDGDFDVVRTRPECETFVLAWLESFGGGFTVIGNCENAFAGPGGVYLTDSCLHALGENDQGLNEVVAVYNEDLFLRGVGESLDWIPGEALDFDLNGQPDVVVYSEVGDSAHWFRGPTDPINDDPRDEEANDQFFPWEVFDIAHGLTPSAMDVGDIDGDGILDVVIAFGGRIRWYSALENDVFGLWTEMFVHDDGDGSASIRSVLVVDLDGDGLSDIVATIDRDNTNNDSLIWFRNRGQ